MKLTRTMGLLLSITTATVLSAQGTKPATPPAKPATAPAASTAKPAPAPAAKEATAHADAAHLVLHVTGLTKENQTTVKDALTALGTNEYVCPKCKHEQATAGKCAACKVDLVAQKQHAFSAVTVALDGSTVTLTPATNVTAKLSEVEGTLARSSVQVDESRLTLPGSATLVLRGAGADGAPAIEKALKDAKLFDEVHATYDAPKNEIEVQVSAGSNAPTRPAVAKTIEAANSKVKLEDVVWGHARKI